MISEFIKMVSAMIIGEQSHGNDVPKPIIGPRHNTPDYLRKILRQPETSHVAHANHVNLSVAKIFAPPVTKRGTAKNDLHVIIM